MSRGADARGQEDEPYQPRPGDELVEPLFGALRQEGEPEPEPAAEGWLRRLVARIAGRRRAATEDWFTCPVCGATVPSSAAACRECGSDDTTGWSAATEYDDLDLPDPPTGDPHRPPGRGERIPDTFEEFTAGHLPGPAAPAGNRRPRMLIALLALALALLALRALLALLSAA